mmetsp:Transcript_15521/g.32809  ORF Transcript_15521/g.32809 Transcript_15521/m.32809 type:complete len:218 (+) Transcript_15521:47-700(+)
MKIVSKIALCCAAISSVEAFAPPASSATTSVQTSASALHFFGGGSGAKDLDEEWERQQELLKLRQASPEEREKYFQSVEDRRIKATEDQIDKWAWQKKQYAKGEDPIDEWRKRRESGQISDLENQYGDPEKIGGIPLPMASFGVGGEFGVGGKFDNGGRFDLRLPYAEQGWVDEEASGNPFANLFGGGKKKKQAEEKEVQAKEEEVEKPKKNGFWPF